MKLIFIALLILSASGSLFAGNTDKDHAQFGTTQKAILVTGASSGIGKNIALRLAKNGFFVYAGARKKTDIQALSSIKNIQGIRLDVTVQDDIDAAVKTVTQGGRGLYALVNNAGVAVFEPLIEISEKTMQFQMDVNLFGPYRVTKAFAPMIIQSKGRITSTGSIAGVNSFGLGGPYSMSKYALEAFTDSLADELKKFDVHVSIIEPGNYDSNVIKNRNKRKNKQTARQSLYQEEMQKLNNYFPEDRSQFKKPDDVSAAVLHALFDENPKNRYMVVPVAREAEITISAVLKLAIQLNEGHKFSFDRAALINMLDKHLSESKH